MPLNSGDAGPDAAASQDAPDNLPLSRLIILTLACFFAVMVLKLVSTSFPSRALALGIGLPSLTMMLALVFWIASPEVERWPRWHRLAVLVASALVTYLPIIILGQLWAVMVGFFAGAALILLSGWAAWALFGVVIGSMLAGTLIGAEVLSDIPRVDVAFLTLSTLTLGLVVFGLIRLSLLVRQARSHREEHVQLAVIRERMRFARDLHDLVGYSLSTIILKAEVTQRMVGSDPDRARDELAEIIHAARQAMADIRTVSTGYRNISLVKEASSVAPLLREAGIDAQVKIDCGPLDETVDTVLATVLRETVTNMLKHSAARHCVIEAGINADTIYLHVASDGTPHRTAVRRAGGGLDNLATRMAAIGGQLSAQALPDDWFDVLAECHRHSSSRLRPHGNGRIRSL